MAPCHGFVTCPRMNRVSLCVCTVGLGGFTITRSGFVIPALATEQTLSLSVWSFIEKTVGLVKFTMGYFGLNVLSINLNTDSPSWSYESRGGLASSYCLCYNNCKTFIVICTTQFTQSFSLCLITRYCLMDRAIASI
jgi:hypothetical protein